MKIFLSWLKNYKKEAFFAPFFKLVEAVFELIVPLIIADIIDAIAMGRGREYIIKKGMHLILLAFLCQSLKCIIRSDECLNLLNKVVVSCHCVIKNLEGKLEGLSVM